MAKLILIVDPQIDFVNGTLPVPFSDDSMNNLGIYLKSSAHMYEAKAISVDFHPFNHCSFIENGGKWPAHCIAHTKGAAIWPGLNDALFSSHGEPIFLEKGCEADKEEYSLFMSNESAEKFREIVVKYSITEVDVCGLVREICVLTTIDDMHRIYPSMKVNVLMKYTPTLDAGVEFSKYLEKNNEWLNVVI